MHPWKIQQLEYERLFAIQLQTYIVVMDDDYHYHFCYLSMILDAYSEEIVGWIVGPTLDTDYPMAALRMALKRINNTMKNELLKGKVFRSIEEVFAAVALAVDFYNNRRPHMSIGMMIPMEASEST